MFPRDLSWDPKLALPPLDNGNLSWPLREERAIAGPDPILARGVSLVERGECMYVYIRIFYMYFDPVRHLYAVLSYLYYAYAL